MYFTLYIGSSAPLPQIEWNKDKPAFHTRNLQDDELGVLDRLTLPHVLYVGTDQGCGCGFRHALIDRKDWLPVVDEDQENLAIERQNHWNLHQYLAIIPVDATVEIYGCWNGDVTDCGDQYSDLKLADITHKDLYFKEGWIYKLAR